MTLQTSLNRLHKNATKSVLIKMDKRDEIASVQALAMFPSEQRPIVNRIYQGIRGDILTYTGDWFTYFNRDAMQSAWAAARFALKFMTSVDVAAMHESIQ